MNVNNRRGFFHVTLIMMMTILVWGAACAQTPEQGEGSSSNRPFLYRGDYDRTELMSSRDAERSKLEMGLSSQISFLHDELEFLLTIDGLSELDRIGSQRALGYKIRMLYARLIELLDSADSAGVSSTLIPVLTSNFVNDLVLASQYVYDANLYAPLVKCVLRRAEALNLYEPKSFLSSVNDMLKMEYPSFYATGNLVTAVWLDDRIRDPGIDSARADTLRQLCTDHARIAVDSLRSDYGTSIACYLLAKRLSSSSEDEAWEYLSRAINLSVESDFPYSAFYSDLYNRDVYVNEAVSFVRAYFEHLINKNKSMDVLEAGEYLLDLGVVNEAQQDRIARAVIYWTERAIRENEDPGEAELFRRLQRFYELDDPETEF